MYEKQLRGKALNKVADNIKEQVQSYREDYIVKTINDLHDAINFEMISLSEKETKLLGEKYIEDIKSNTERFVRFCQNFDIDISMWLKTDKLNT